MKINKNGIQSPSKNKDDVNDDDDNGKKEENYRISYTTTRGRGKTTRRRNKTAIGKGKTSN